MIGLALIALVIAFGGRRTAFPAGQETNGLPANPVTRPVWQKLSSGETVQRSLVSRGSGSSELSTVLSGTAPYAQLAQFAEALKPVPAS